MQSLSKDHVLEIINRFDNDRQQLIAILLDIQTASGKNYVHKEWAKLVSSVLKIPLSRIYDVLTFYSMFSTEPRGEYVIEICKSAPCYFTGGKDTARWFEKAAGIKTGETTIDGKITLAYSSCFGSCGIAPAVKIADDVYGALTEEKVFQLVKYCREDNIKGLKLLCQN